MVGQDGAVGGGVGNAGQHVPSADLVILVDCADPSRLGPLFYRLANEFERHRPIINVDHHVTNTRFGSLNLVVPEAASTAEIMVGLFDELGIEIEPDCAWDRAARMTERGP